MVNKSAKSTKRTITSTSKRPRHYDVGNLGPGLGQAQNRCEFYKDNYS